MAKYKHAYKTKVYDVSYKPGETDMQYYKRLAKVADQRLVRLEELAGQREGKAGTPGYEKVTQYAYARAMRDLENYGGGKRFNTKPPLKEDGTVDNTLLREKLADLRAFLTSVTSTKGGIEQVYKERAKTFNDKFGTNFTWQDLADFYNSGDADKLGPNGDGGWGSSTVLKAIGMIQKSKEKVSKEIEDNKKITQDTAVADVALKILKRKDLNLTEGMTKEQLDKIAKDIRKQKKQKQKRG